MLISYFSKSCYLCFLLLILRVIQLLPELQRRIRMISYRNKKIARNVCVCFLNSVNNFLSQIENGILVGFHRFCCINNKSQRRIKYWSASIGCRFGTIFTFACNASEIEFGYWWVQWWQNTLGAFNNYLGRVLDIFDHPTSKTYKVNEKMSFCL